MTEREAFTRYRNRYPRGLLVEQSPEMPGHLRDFAVARRSFTIFATDPAFRTEAARALGPEELAREVARLPAAPRADPNSYALVNVHAWSYGEIGGPLEAVRRAIDRLPPGTKVITADQVLALLRANFAR